MRVLDAAALAALDSGRFHARNGFAISMQTETFALWDDAYNVTIDGIAYLPGAGVFTITPFPSSGDLSARSVDIVLSGIDSRVASQVMAQPWHQRPVTISRFVMAADAPLVIYARQWFAGFLDHMEWQEKPGGTSDVTARCEDINRELGRKGTRTRSASDQRALYPGDAFFDGTVAATQTDIEWGRSGQQANAEPRRRPLFGLFG